MSGKDQELLIVDDDAGIRRQLKWAFDEFNVIECRDRGSALRHIKRNAPAIVLLDLGLPPDPDGPSEGLQALQEILEIQPTAKVIVMTGQKERAYAVKSVALGAYDFYEKPLDLDELQLIVNRAKRLHALEEEGETVQLASHECAVPGLITANARMRDVAEQLARLAKSDVAVLIAGESGTGKELLSHGVHLLGKRSNGPFIAINCAAIPENLLESELFGHEKGAFTGAHKTTIGKVEQADGGTLMLDEIGDLPLSLQAKLLRVLQEKVIDRVGGRKPIQVNFRLVCATNRDMERAISDGTFREDLFYRISEAVVHIPPLRQRPEDAVLIAQYFLESWSADQQIRNPGFANDALSAISRYSWPGNVRELQSRIKRALATCTGKIGARDLDLSPDMADNITSIKSARHQAELEAIQRAMVQAEGNVSKAAKLLDISRPTLYQLLEEHGLR